MRVEECVQGCQQLQMKFHSLQHKQRQSTTPGLSSHLASAVVGDSSSSPTLYEPCTCHFSPVPVSLFVTSCLQLDRLGHARGGDLTGRIRENLYDAKLLQQKLEHLQVGMRGG